MVPDYLLLELELPGNRRLTTPYTRGIGWINLCDGIMFQGEIYRIQRAGYKTLDDGKRVRTLKAVTVQEFHETAKTQVARHPLFSIHDLDEVLGS